ncbi:histone acetyltransferase KAT6A-like [Channa argus]|uniref:histone acetyltransferase KAT6A-like n=1 Tax=Channa argus TaxID=215402 RepID=UPI002947DA1D|nr:hypothetical protein Q8A73_021485 [Channa argus]
MENSDKDTLLLQSLGQTQSGELNADVSSEPELEQQFESEPDTQPESNQEKPEPETVENSDKDSLLLQSLRRTQSGELNADVSSEPEQEQQFESEPDTQPESNQEKPEPGIEPQSLASIERRIQHLHNRRFILLRTESFRNRAGYNNDSTTGEMTSEDSDEVCELDTIQKELKELLVKKEELEKQQNSSSVTLNEKKMEDDSSLYSTEKPYGGVYMLPPSQLNKEETAKIGPTAQIPIDSILPVERLGRTSVVTRCPFCQEIISTKTSSSVSEAMWLLCCLCSLMGCVAGCCLIPFFADSLKKVQHQCPNCWANISTYQPF